MSVDPIALGQAVKRLQDQHRRALDAALTEMGTTLAQHDALRAINEMPGSSAHALAVATFQSDQSFGTLANRLATRGLIERRPGYGRRVEHYLTAAGERVFKAAYPIANEVFEASFANLSESERSALLELLLRSIEEG